MEPLNDTLIYSGNWHTSVPDSLLQSNELTGFAKLLWIAIASYSNPRTNVCWPGRSTLVRIMGGVSARSFTRYKKELIDHGWLACEQEHGHAGRKGKCIYTVIDNSNDYHKSPVAKTPVAKTTGSHQSTMKYSHYIREEEQEMGEEGVPPKSLRSNGGPRKSINEIDSQLRDILEDMKALKVKGGHESPTGFEWHDKVVLEEWKQLNQRRKELRTEKRNR